ncbi:MAG: hypothetical protein AAB320_05415 [Elusimicrobiota bacterium]
MIRLAEGVFSWGYFNPEKKFNFNGYLFTGLTGTLVVDPPPLSEDDQAYLDQLGLWPDLIVITNRNHVRDHAFFQSRKPVTTVMHEAEAALVEVRVERRVKEGEVLAPGLTVVHLPGKSPGEIGLYWKERGILMLGDALIAPCGRLKMVPAEKQDSPVQLKASLHKLKALSFDVLLPGDGDPILHDAKARVEEFLHGIA